MQMTYAGLAKALTALKGAGVMLETATLQLIGQPLAESPTLVAGDIIVPTFTGYADAAIASWTVGVDADGNSYLTTAPKVFAPTAGTDLPQYLYGAAILDADGDLLEVDVWDAPLQVVNSGQQIHVTPKVKLDQLQDGAIEGYTE